MDEIKGKSPFNTTVGASKNDARDNEDALRSRREEQPDVWHAVRLARYWDDVASVALMKPDSVDLDSLHILVDGQPVPFTHGPGIVPVLTPISASRLTVMHDREEVEVPITVL